MATTSKGPAKRGASKKGASTPQKRTIKDDLFDGGHIAILQGKEYVLLSGLLDLAHGHGIESIATAPVAIDMAAGTAVFSCTASGSRGTFSGHGDSTPQNTGKMVKEAFIRIAETRSVCRALRFYLGIGMTARDELPGDAVSGDSGTYPKKSGRGNGSTGASAAAPTHDSNRGGRSWKDELAAQVLNNPIMQKIEGVATAQFLEMKDVGDFYSHKKGESLDTMTERDQESFLAWFNTETGAREVRQWIEAMNGPVEMKHE